MAEPTAPAPAPDRTAPDYTVPLLTLITQRSLDADYEHVAARRRAEGDRPGRPHPVPRRTAALVLVVFGLLVTVAAVQTSRNASSSDASRESLIQQVNQRRQAVAGLQRQIASEQRSATALNQQLTSLSTAARATQAKVQRLAARTGFGAVRGPGVQVTVSSAPGSGASQLVRDSDLSLLTDALWAAGAEAISVNGQRLTVLSAFRNVGIGILVNSQPINPPYVFSVVGNPDNLPAGLLSSSAGGQWYALKDSLGFQFEVKNGGTMSLPAARIQPLRSARIATAKNAETRMQNGSSPS